MFNLPILLYRKDNGQFETSFLDLDNFSNFLINNPNITKRYMGNSLFNEKHDVSFYISDDQIAFGSINDKSSKYGVYVGPCLLADPTEKLMHSMLNRGNSPFKDNPEKYYDQLFEYIKKLPKLTIERFLWLLSFTNNYVNQEVLDYNKFHQVSIPKNRIDLNEKNILNIPYEEAFDAHEYITLLEEIKILILNSSDKTTEDYWLDNSNRYFNNLLKEENDIDNIRFYKNSFIQFLMYFMPSLIEKGISEKQIVDLNNQLINEVERAIVKQQIEALYLKAISSYTKIVNKTTIESKSDNIIINRALNYIHDNINNPINSNDIADSIGISRGYLSSLFNKELKMKISDYINQEKIEVAKSLLFNSENHIIDISNYLSFSSQNYFQNIFKKYTGLTPLKYQQNKLNKTN